MTGLGWFCEVLPTWPAFRKRYFISKWSEKFLNQRPNLSKLNHYIEHLTCKKFKQYLLQWHNIKMLASFLVKSLSLLFRLIFSLFEKAKVKTHCRLHAKYFYISSNVRHFASKYFVFQEVKCYTRKDFTFWMNAV